MSLKKYNKKSNQSYALGIAPTLDLLREKPAIVKKVIINLNAKDTKAIDEIKSLCQKNKIRVEYASRAIEKIAVKENTYAVGIFEKYQSFVDTVSNHIVLINPSDPGNLGTIIRTMLGFNFNNLVIIRPAVDMFDPKVVRSAMGALFNINFEYFTSFEEYAKKYKRSFYPFMLQGAQELKSVNFKEPFSLIFGKESTGLPDSFLKTGQSVYIDQSKKIDSFNLSIAVGIALHTIFSQKNV